MSSNAAVAAAQRRRASPANGGAASNTKMGEPQRGPDAGKTLGLSDVLGLQSRQLMCLRGYQEGNEKHWEANDEFLHELSRRVDELTEAGKSSSFAADAGPMPARVSALESTVAALQAAVAALQDELIREN